MGKTILIVDDEVHIVDALSLKFRQSRFDVVCAYDGKEGLRMARKVVPDLVITDFKMPCMNGIEMVRELRADRVTRHIPIIMLTAMEQEVEERCPRDIASVNHIMGKPFSPREMLSRAMDLLGEKKCR